jgi:LPXTG-site transpeptidase (sortase) family protein
MAPRRPRRRPWYRTRAYRLVRTAALTAVLVTVGTRCAGHLEHGAPDRTAGSRVAAPAVSDADGNGGHGPGNDGADGAGPDGEGSPPHRSARPSSPPPAPLPPSPATYLRIPSLGIEAPVIGVGLDAGRQLETPPVDRPKLVGWYEDGPTPGESGTAVAVGHRDTMKGAAVFAALGQVETGRAIDVRRADGRTAVYTVDQVQVFDKDRFPDKEVYGPVHRPELRVITCGGLYTRRTGYSSNVVVFAHLTATR